MFFCLWALCWPWHKYFVRFSFISLPFPPRALLSYVELQIWAFCLHWHACGCSSALCSNAAVLEPCSTATPPLSDTNLTSTTCCCAPCNKCRVNNRERNSSENMRKCETNQLENPGKNNDARNSCSATPTASTKQGNGFFSNFCSLWPIWTSLSAREVWLEWQALNSHHFSKWVCTITCTVAALELQANVHRATKYAIFWRKWTER